MHNAPPAQEFLDRFLRASDDLIEIGKSRSGNIEVALESFRGRLNQFLKTHFVERAVAEMLDHSFAEFENELKTNVASMSRICTEGSQWYAHCVGAALGKRVAPPVLPEPLVDSNVKAKAASNSTGR